MKKTKVVRQKISPLIVAYHIMKDFFKRKRIVLNTLLQILSFSFQTRISFFRIEFGFCCLGFQSQRKESNFYVNIY